MKIVAITQARYSSSRLPGKVLKNLGSGTVLDLHLKRIKKSKRLTHFIVATTNEPEAFDIERVASRNGFIAFHGSLDDVLDRFYQACKDLKPDYVVRLTSDCPLIDSKYIDDLVDKFLIGSVEYAANFIEPTLPDGMDAEIFTFKTLVDAWKYASKKSEREHVTPYIRESGKFTTLSVRYPLDYGRFRITLDTLEDYVVIDKIVKACGEDVDMETAVKFLINNTEVAKINSVYERNEGMKKSIQEDEHVKTDNKL